jgi:hypothetical protein
MLGDGSRTVALERKIFATATFVRNFAKECYELGEVSCTLRIAPLSSNEGSHDESLHFLYLNAVTMPHRKPQALFRAPHSYPSSFYSPFALTGEEPERQVQCAYAPLKGSPFRGEREF